MVHTSKSVERLTACGQGLIRRQHIRNQINSRVAKYLRGNTQFPLTDKAPTEGQSKDHGR